MRQVTVLGGCGEFAEPGRACSGFSVEWDGYRLLLTHFWPGNDRAAAAAAAAVEFGADVLTADEGRPVQPGRDLSEPS